jgi:hypothetical protein
MRPILGSTGAVLAVFVLVLPARAVTRSPSRAMTIRLLSQVAARGVSVDHAPMGVPNKGDVAWARSVLRNQVPQFGHPKGVVVGSDYATYTVLSGSGLGATALVRVRVKLPGGTLRVQGRVGANSLSGTDAVVGGTGSFAGARGTQYVRDLNRDGSRSVNVYHLRLP